MDGISNRLMLAVMCLLSSALAMSFDVAAADKPVGSLPIRFGSHWRYFKGVSDPAEGWDRPGFDDSDWLIGPSGFGMGSGEHATVLDDMRSRYVSLYIRKRFLVENPDDIRGLVLQMHYDDGFVAYINGVQVARAHMPGSERPRYFAIAFPVHEPEPLADFSIDGDGLRALVPGENVLAIQGHNVRLSNSDFTLTPALFVRNSPPNQPTVVSPADGARSLSTAPALTAEVVDLEAERMNVSVFGREVGPPTPTGADFTIVALPDTQYYSQDFPQIFTAQTQWIVDNREAMNIAYVAHLGDIVQVWSEANRWQFENADASLSLFESDPPVPYGLAVGNHDGGSSQTRLFNEFFGIQRFQDRPWYGGHYEEDNDNHFDLITVGGLDFVIVYLEFAEEQLNDRLRWADRVLNRYHDRRGIVVSHFLIHVGDPGGWGERGHAIYEALKDNPNLFLMLCGHVPGEGIRTETFNGNTVHIVLANYQDRVNGGNGWLRIMRFSPRRNTISVSTYSPWLEAFEDDPDSRFVLPYDMSEPPFERIARVHDVASGANVSVDWPQRAPCGTYEWYVAPTDGTTRTSGPIWQFSVDAAGGPNACDTSCDGKVDVFDISPFLDLLTGVSRPCSRCAGDINDDGSIDAFDIEPFLDCLFP